MSLIINKSDIDNFKKDGAILIKGLLNNFEVKILQEGIDSNISNPSPLSKIASSENDPGVFFEDFCTWQKNKDYQRVIFKNHMSKIAARLMCSKQVRLYHDHVLVKTIFHYVSLRQNLMKIQEEQDQLVSKN